jgi:aryl-alcohol dehydrogenase-like predicted oxidoreductase
VTGALEIERRQLGADGPLLPRIALGCGNFGGLGSALELRGRGLSDELAFAVMDAAWGMGISHFDTADAYAGGHSEQTTGHWIAHRLPASLERLGVHRVELYLAHAWDRVVPVAEWAGAFEKLKEAGMIGAYGVSNVSSLELMHALSAGSPAAVQDSYSLLERGDELDVITMCAERGVTYCAYSPLAGGWLTGKYRRGDDYPAGSRMTQRPEPYERLARSHMYDAVEALQRFAAQRGSSPIAVALAWVLAQENVAQLIVGPGRPEHLEPVAEALGSPLVDDELEELAKIFPV